jgi:hypothetical protein
MHSCVHRGELLATLNVTIHHDMECFAMWLRDASLWY